MFAKLSFIDNCQYHPTNTKELVKVIAQAKENGLTLKYTGGTFPMNADNAEAFISLGSMRRLVSYCPLKNVIQVEPGITLSELVSRMKYMDCTLDVYGTMPDMSVGDAINVGLIGSNASLGSCLRSCQVLLLDLTLHDWLWPTVDQLPEPRSHVTRGDGFRPTLQTLVCGLGTVGVVVKAALECVPNRYAQENVYHTSMERFLSGTKRLKEAMFVNAQWYPLLDRVVVTNASEVRLRLGQFQPLWKRYAELVCWGLYWLCRCIGPVVCSLLNEQARTFSRMQFTFMSLAGLMRTSYSYHPHRFVSVTAFCRGIKWAFPLERLALVTRCLEEWSHEQPHLCTTPVALDFQRHRAVETHAPFLCPYSEGETFTIWTDWFGSASLHSEFSAPMADLETILQRTGGRKCWSAGPVYASPLIGQLYPGYKHWCETRTILDSQSVFRSAYIEGDVIGEK